METNQYMDMFLDESREHLQSLNDGLLSLENDPNEVSVVNEIFRNAHTLKGMSATMGFNKIAELTHEMEDVLYIREHGLSVLQSASPIRGAAFTASPSARPFIVNRHRIGYSQLGQTSESGHSLQSGRFALHLRLP